MRDRRHSFSLALIEPRADAARSGSQTSRSAVSRRRSGGVGALLGSVDFVAEVLGGGLVGGAPAAGVVLQHDLHGVALAAADGGGIEAGVYQFGAGPLAQREDGGVELAGVLDAVVGDHAGVGLGHRG